MKNCIKVLLIIALTTFSIRANAQTIMVKGGINHSQLKGSGNDEENLINIGAHIGATITHPLNKYLFFETGVLINSKGRKLQLNRWGTQFDFDMNLYYVDIPLTIKGMYNIDNNINLFGVVGPYIGYGVTGSTTMIVEDDEGTEEETEDIDWGDGEDEIKRLDYGLIIGGGIEIKQVQIGIYYDMGLANISNDDKYDVYNRVFKLTFAYMINMK